MLGSTLAVLLGHKLELGPEDGFEEHGSPKENVRASMLKFPSDAATTMLSIVAVKGPEPSPYESYQ